MEIIVTFASTWWIADCYCRSVVMRGLVFMAVGLLWGCTGKPVPEVPSLAPPNPDEIDFMSGTSVPGDVRGGPGAVEPGAQVWLAPLDQPVAPTVAAAAADGSFATMMMVFPGEEVRIQARLDDLRSDPVDVLVGAGAIVRPSADCLTLSPALELAMGEVAVGDSATASIEVDNACGAEVQIGGIRLRAPSTSVFIDTIGPLVVADGTTGTIDITFRPDASGLSEEVVILDVTAPEMDRRPVTVFGFGQ